MEIKGTAVKPTIDFVREKFPDKYTEWINNLPESSKKIIDSGVISASTWYPINESTIIPTKILGEMFYNDVADAAAEVGRYSAEKSLHGIYKIFVKISTPNFLISKTANVFSSYYNPSRITYESVSENSAILNIYEFDDVDELMLYRIAGWIQRAFEITGRKEVNAKVSKHTENERVVYRITASWF